MIGGKINWVSKHSMETRFFSREKRVQMNYIGEIALGRGMGHVGFFWGGMGRKLGLGGGRQRSYQRKDKPKRDFRQK